MAICEFGSFEKDAFGRRGWKGKGKSLLRKAERPASCVEIISRCDGPSWAKAPGTRKRVYLRI